jgi:class 3 adenylate cyclase
MTSLLEGAREAFTRQAWREACDAFAAAAEKGPLRVEDHERFAVAAYLVGADEPCERQWEAAQRAAVEAGDTAGGARFAVLLALCLGMSCWSALPATRRSGSPSSARSRGVVATAGPRPRASPAARSSADSLARDGRSSSPLPETHPVRWLRCAMAMAGDVLLREPAALLPACIAVAIIAGDDVMAADSLERLKALPGPSAAAAALTAEGHLALRDGRAEEAVSVLRRGVAAYFEMHAPFEAARARTLLGHALRACGDAAAADLEQEAARATLERIGASLELEPAVADPGGAGGRLLVTFMFTDIVGSTWLLDELGDDGWSDLLTRHDTIVRSAFGAHGGREIKHEGDGFFVAFRASGDAVTAGCAIQSALARARESDDSIPPVRVAIHSAHATARGGDFIGRGVHEAARLAAAAAGGEVLVSATTLATAGDGYTAVDARNLVLRGFADPFPVASVSWS